MNQSMIFAYVVLWYIYGTACVNLNNVKYRCITRVHSFIKTRQFLYQLSGYMFPTCLFWQHWPLDYLRMADTVSCKKNKNTKCYIFMLMCACKIYRICKYFQQFQMWI